MGDDGEKGDIGVTGDKGDIVCDEWIYSSIAQDA